MGLWFLWDGNKVAWETRKEPHTFPVCPLTPVRVWARSVCYLSRKPKIRHFNRRAKELYLAAIGKRTVF